MPDIDVVWPSMAQSALAFSEVLTEFLQLRGSTTFYLEARSAFRTEVDVEVLEQSIEAEPSMGGEVLRRVSRLYLHQPEHALVVAEATIYLAKLPKRYHDALIARAIGIGKVLDPNNLGLIEKQDIDAVIVRAPSLLRTHCGWAVSRLYRLWFDGACCAEIREICNDESLARLTSRVVGNGAAVMQPAEVLASSRSSIRLGTTSMDVPSLLSRGRGLWRRHCAARVPALMGIDDHDTLALLLAALADDRDVVLCPANARMPAQYDTRIGASGDAEEVLSATSGGAIPGGFAVLSSGTLGMPKLIWHRTTRLLATAEIVAARLNLTAGERVLITVPVHHLYGLGAALIPALLAHAEIQLLPRANLLNFNDALRVFQPQRVYSTPHLMRALLQRKEAALPYSHGLVLAGDGIPAKLHAQAVRVFHRVHNLYGSSELGVIAISEANAPQALLPLPGVVALPMDPDVERTSLRIIHPFSATHIGTDGVVSALAQPYDTRDIASFAEDGTFTLHGRADLSLNRAGKLVLLGELEQIAMDWPGVVFAVAVPMEEITAAGQAITLVVKSNDASLTLRVLRAQAASSLPVFARPDHFRIVSDLPCLTNGKPDRSAIYKEYRYGTKRDQ